MRVKPGRYVLAVLVGVVVGIGCNPLEFIPDDFFEFNNSFLTAYDLSGEEGNPLSNISGTAVEDVAKVTDIDPEDYYVIVIPTGVTTLTVNLTAFADSGDLTLYLYDDTLIDPLFAAFNGTLAQVNAAGVTEGQTFYVKVELAPGVGLTPYEMGWNWTP